MTPNRQPGLRPFVTSLCAVTLWMWAGTSNVHAESNPATVDASAGNAIAVAEPLTAETVAPLRASRILVDKSQRLLTLFSAGKPIRQYPISLGLNPKGHKLQEGDRRTPEGIYLIDFKNPDSAFYRSLKVSYPNERDRLVAEERGFEPGGQIMIHGAPNGRLIKTSSSYGYDWTDGCIAVSNAAMDELWQLVDLGTLIEIRP